MHVSRNTRERLRSTLPAPSIWVGLKLFDTRASAARRQRVNVGPHRSRLACKDPFLLRAQPADIHRPTGIAVAQSQRFRTAGFLFRLHGFTREAARYGQHLGQRLMSQSLASGRQRSLSTFRISWSQRWDYATTAGWLLRRRKAALNSFGNMRTRGPA